MNDYTHVAPVPASIFEYDGFTVDFAELPEASREALLRLGFSTKIKNATAGLIPAILGKSKNSDAHWTEEEIVEEMTAIGWEEVEDLEGFAKAFARRAQEDMFEAILEGNVSAGVRGPRAAGPDRVFMQVAKEMLRDAAARKGGKLPRNSKGKGAPGEEGYVAPSTAYSDLLEKYIAAKRSEIQAEADARIARAASAAGDDLDFLDLD